MAGSATSKQYIAFTRNLVNMLFKARATALGKFASSI